MKSHLVTFFVLIFISGGIYLYYVVGSEAQLSRATAMGEGYIANMYADYAVIGKTCQSEDADKDGYLTCNFRIKKEPSERMISLLCPTLFKSYRVPTCKEKGQ